MTPLPPTPGQTIGPFFGYALPYPGGPHLVPPARADAIRVHGHVYDGAGAPVPDALIEIWQPDAAGVPVQRPGSLARDPHEFTGWARAATDNAGHWSVTTVLPAATGRGHAPFFAVAVFARGLLDRLATRIYLPGADDPFLASLPADRRGTLIATAEGRDLVFDIRLQGTDETVFLQFPSHG